MDDEPLIFNGVEVNEETIAKLERASNKLKKYVITCECCKEDFHTNAAHARYCSRTCKRKAKSLGPIRLERPKKTCEHCKKEFAAIQPNQKFCSKRCRVIFLSTEKTCERCGGIFISKSARFCSEECRKGTLSESAKTRAAISPLLEKHCLNCGLVITTRKVTRKFCSLNCHTEHRKKIKLTSVGKPKQKVMRAPLGRYVYAWLDDGAVFYIGRGSGDRVTESHGASSCQAWREKIGERFSYAIIYDNLTDEGSMLVESVLIKLICPPCNILVGMSRRERPPLTLPRVLESLKPTLDPPLEGVDAFEGYSDGRG